MSHNEQDILQILDDCCESFDFPVLDNGYVYLAATRLALFRSATDWAITMEVFGFSPRSGLPDTHIFTFGSALTNRKQESDYVSREAYERYLATNPYHESRFVFPVDEGNWIDADEPELVAPEADELMLRGRAVQLPSPMNYQRLGISCREPPRVAVFELCRALAGMYRSRILASEEELTVNVSRKMREVLRLDEWHHPDVVGDCRPSGSSTFQQLAAVLVTGDAARYQPRDEPNTHWKHWPEGGTL